MTNIETNESRLEAIVGSKEISDKRRESLVMAIELGASDKLLVQIRDAIRIARNSTTIVLPSHHYEGLSRGKGWCRKGRGDGAVWGERTDGGYCVGPGRWTVGASDGFSRKGSDDWQVTHVIVGGRTWTVAS